MYISQPVGNLLAIALIFSRPELAIISATHVKYSLGSSETVKSVTQTRNAFTLLLIYRQTFYFSSIALFHIFLSLGLYLACHCWCSPLFVTTFTSWQPYILLPDCTGNTSPSQDICINWFHWLTAALDHLNKCDLIGWRWHWPLGSWISLDFDSKHED